MLRYLRRKCIKFIVREITSPRAYCRGIWCLLYDGLEVVVEASLVGCRWAHVPPLELLVVVFAEDIQVSNHGVWAAVENLEHSFPKGMGDVGCVGRGELERACAGRNRERAIIL